MNEERCKWKCEKSLKLKDDRMSECLHIGFSESDPRLGKFAKEHLNVAIH